MSEAEEDFGYKRLCVPESWVIEKFDIIFDSVSTNGKKLKLSEYLSEGTLPVIDQGEGLIGGYTNDHSKAIHTPQPVIGFGDHTRKFKFINFDFAPGADGLKVLKPIIIDERYAFYACLAIRFPNKGYARHFGYLAKSDFPLAPLNEQKRIVEKIEELFSQIDAGEAALKKARALIKQYRQSLLKAAVTGELTKEWREKNKGKLEPADKLLARILAERRKVFVGRGKYKEPQPLDTTDLAELPEGWGWAKLEQLSTRITDGTHQPPKQSPSGIPFVVINNVMGGYIDWESVCRWVSQDEYELHTSRCRPERDDILYTAVGSYGTALRVNTDKAFMFQRHIAHIKPVRNLINLDYLVYLLNSPFTLSRAHKVARGVAQKTVTLGDLCSFPVPLPPFEEQCKISQIIEEKMALVEAFEKSSHIASLSHQALKQSILKAAFSGQLVPQDPNDEPASVLLERIKVERDGTNNKSTKRTAKQQQPAATRASKRASK